MGDELPRRTLDTMSMAIGMSSPSGRMSKRARDAASERLRVALFGGWRPEPTPSVESRREADLTLAATLRNLATAGMRPRVHRREAEKLEAKWRHTNAGRDD
jgi:hypothetical protein